MSSRLQERGTYPEELGSIDRRTMDALPLVRLREDSRQVPGAK